MKIEQLIVQYLYQNKSVAIQDIGNFTISPDVVIPGEKEKETTLPEGAIQFHYNPREQKDEGLIDYIVDQTRKIRFLALSDLESYSNLSRQFLNIGKPMEIPGLGSLQKNQEGVYEFIQGKTLHSRVEKKHKFVEEKKAEDISFSTPAKEKRSNTGIMATVIILFLIGTAAAVYYLLNNQEDKNLVVTEPAPVAAPADTLTTNVAAIADTNTTTQANIPASTTATPASNDGYNFKIVIKEYNSKAAADKAFARLTSYGHQLVLGQKDSSTYQIMMPFSTPISDTLRAKDSLRKFFGGSPFVKL